jgi:hypothetical protein
MPPKELSPNKERGVPLEVKLWLGLNWDVPEGDCWVWKGAKSKSRGGHGVIGLAEGTFYVHRVVYEVVYGVKLTPADTILHLCDNPTCANPEHLLRGNEVDNRVDMAVKFRGRFKNLSDNYARFLYEKLKRRFEPSDGGEIPKIDYK